MEKQHTTIAADAQSENTQEQTAMYQSLNRAAEHPADDRGATAVSENEDEPYFLADYPRPLSFFD